MDNNNHKRRGHNNHGTQSHYLREKSAAFWAFFTRILAYDNVDYQKLLHFGVKNATIFLMTAHLFVIL